MNILIDHSTFLGEEMREKISENGPSSNYIPGALRNNNSFLESISDGNYDVDTICNGDFLAEHVFRPVTEDTIQAVIQSCAAAPGKLLPDKWSICTNGEFNCGSMLEYTSACEEKATYSMDTIDVPTSTEGRQARPPCGMGDFLEQGEAILLLVGLVFIGVLIGVAITVGVCLICPRVHTWASSKVRRDKRLREKSLHMRQSHLTNSSTYYTDIDDRINQLSVGNSLDRQASAESTGSDRPVLPVQTSMDTPTYFDSGVSQMTEPVYTDASGDNSVDTYEELKRTNTTKQSHTYAHLPGYDSVGAAGSMRPCTSPENDNGEVHNYFVLENN